MAHGRSRSGPGHQDPKGHVLPASSVKPFSIIRLEGNVSSSAVSDKKFRVSLDSAIGQRGLPECDQHVGIEDDSAGHEAIRPGIPTPQRARE
ncbi:hypothetical protein E4U53_008182 [Claviceps sorghi]|nr:hypothetical protein E4U53_008182 [Claviceps sorghi]